MPKSCKSQKKDQCGYTIKTKRKNEQQQNNIVSFMERKSINYRQTKSKDKHFSRKCNVISKNQHKLFFGSRKLLVKEY